MSNPLEDLLGLRLSESRIVHGYAQLIFADFGGPRDRGLMKLDDFLDSLIPHLKVLQKDENGELFYELMSGAFIWNDEKMDGLNVNEIGCLRAIFRYRTSLVIQQHDERFALLWAALREKCPEWIGFAPERCSPNQNLAKRYQEERRKAFSELGINNAS